MKREELAAIISRSYILKGLLSAVSVAIFAFMGLWFARSDGNQSAQVAKQTVSFDVRAVTRPLTFDFGEMEVIDTPIPLRYHSETKYNDYGIVITRSTFDDNGTDSSARGASNYTMRIAARLRDSFDESNDNKNYTPISIQRTIEEVQVEINENNDRNNPESIFSLVKSLKDARQNLTMTALGVPDVSEWNGRANSIDNDVVKLLNNALTLTIPRFYVDALNPGEQWHYEVLVDETSIEPLNVVASGTVKIEYRVDGYVKDNDDVLVVLTQQLVISLKGKTTNASPGGPEEIVIVGDGSGKLIFSVSKGIVLQSYIDVVQRFGVSKDNGELGTYRSELQIGLAYLPWAQTALKTK